MASNLRKRYRTALEEDFPENLKIVIGSKVLDYEKKMSLRYGENPHQPAAFYTPKDRHLTTGSMKIIKTGKGGLSQTNIEDINNSIRIVSYFQRPACAVMKHLNPSGVSVDRGDDVLVEIYRRARDCDSTAAFGSIVGFNSKVDGETAEEILSSFVEGIVAPSFEGEALEKFKSKKNLRVIQTQNIGGLSRFIGELPEPLGISMQSDGSLVVSHPLLTKIRDVDDLRMVTDRKASQREALDLLFSWYVCINVRSNGVVLSKDSATIGIGTGQQDRVTAVRLALEKALERGNKGKIPSIKDREVIEECNDHGIAMAFTDERCFRHF
jgi:phosphoribosylaminoimidazolecarboxamide formyltransferase/IMP cyclohydrolase